MILEVASLNIRRGDSADFERAFAEAQAIIASRPGYGWRVQRMRAVSGRQDLAGFTQLAGEAARSTRSMVGHCLTIDQNLRGPSRS